MLRGVLGYLKSSIDRAPSENFDDNKRQSQSFSTTTTNNNNNQVQTDKDEDHDVTSEDTESSGIHDTIEDIVQENDLSNGADEEEEIEVLHDLTGNYNYIKNISDEVIETQDTEIIQKEQLSDDEESDATRRPLDQPVGISARYGSIARPQLSIIENDSIFGTENGSEEDDEQETLRLAELSRREQVMKSYEEFSSSTPDDDDEDDDENSYSSSDQFLPKDEISVLQDFQSDEDVPSDQQKISLKLTVSSSHDENVQSGDANSNNAVSSVSKKENMMKLYQVMVPKLNPTLVMMNLPNPMMMQTRLYLIRKLKFNLQETINKHNLLRLILCIKRHNIIHKNQHKHQHQPNQDKIQMVWKNQLH